MGISPHLDTIFEARDAVEEAVELLVKRPEKIKVGSNIIFKDQRRKDSDVISSAIGWWLYLSDYNREILEDLGFSKEVTTLTYDLIDAEKYDLEEVHHFDPSAEFTWNLKPNVIAWFESFLELLDDAVDEVMFTTVRP